MKNSNTLLTTLLALTSTVLGQIATCDGNQAPDWDDCDTIYAYNRGGVDFIPNPFPNCALYSPPPDIDPKSLNCRIQWCATGPDVRETFSGADGDYDLLGLNCKPMKAGGGAGRQGAWTLQVFNNPDFEIGDGLMSSGTLGAANPDIIPSGRVGGGSSRIKPRQAQDDTGFTLVVSSRSVEREGVQITGRLPAGSTYMVSQTDEKSTSVSVSAEVGGGFFEFFSASIGTSVTAEQSTSNSVGISVNIPCNDGQSGQVFWYPLYDVYSGFTTPSNTNVEVAVPQDNSVSGSNYRVVCLE